MTDNLVRLRKAAYTTMTPIDEPVEIRLRGRGSNRRGYQVTAWVTAHGTIADSCQQQGGAYDESLSNLQPKLMFPRKAVPGWQAEFIAATASGLYDVEEIR